MGDWASAVPRSGILWPQREGGSRSREPSWVWGLGSGEHQGGCLLLLPGPHDASVKVKTHNRITSWSWGLLPHLGSFIFPSRVPWRVKSPRPALIFPVYTEGGYTFHVSLAMCMRPQSCLPCSRYIINVFVFHPAQCWALWHPRGKQKYIRSFFSRYSVPGWDPGCR